MGPVRERKPKGGAKNGGDPQRHDTANKEAVQSEWVWLLLPFLAVAVVVVVNGVRAGSIALPGFLGGGSEYQGDRGFGDLYDLLGVERDADSKAIKKEYRKKAKIWHPDRPTGDEHRFAAIARAYTVLTDTEMREIFDRLGEDGLRRLQDGDPRVKKGWLPPDEVLRRAGPPGPPQNALDSFVTGIFAWLEGAKSYD